MSKSVRPFLGELTTFAKAFPDVKSVRVSAIETGDGIRGASREHRMSATSIQPEIRCSNPLCKRGGVALEQRLQLLVSERKARDEWDESCQGDEGSPAGRKIGRPCLNRFHVNVEIEYK